jgi:hypothetical protein
MRFMQARLGHDFSRVRVHADARSAKSASAVSAHAYTIGQDIVFGAGRYAPETTDGKRLLAHELTHVIQQGGPTFLQRQVAKDIAAQPPPRSTSPAIPELGPDTTNVEQEDEERLEEALVVPETVDPVPDPVYVSHDRAPDEETFARTLAGKASPSRVLIHPTDPTEREAEVVSRAVLGRSDGGPVAIRHLLDGHGATVQRKFNWEDRNKLTWADFTGAVPKGSPFDAATTSGIASPNLGVKTEASPESPILPSKCKIGKNDDVRYKATVGFNFVPYNIQAWMEETKSWVRPGKQSVQLLSHEQGHFDISNVMAEKMDWAVLFWNMTHSGSAVRCGKVPSVNAATKAWNALKPNKAIGSIYKQGTTSWNRAQADYDLDTGHGVNAAEQKTWEGQIAANLPNYTVK